jgi:hypothetical protein
MNHESAQTVPPRTLVIIPPRSKPMDFTCTRSMTDAQTLVSSLYRWSDVSLREFAAAAVGLPPPRPMSYSALAPSTAHHALRDVVDPRVSGTIDTPVPPSLGAECLAAWWRISVAEVLAGASVTADGDIIGAASGVGRFGPIAGCAQSYRSLAPAADAMLPPNLHHASLGRVMCSLYPVANMTVRIARSFSEKGCAARAFQRAPSSPNGRVFASGRNRTPAVPERVMRTKVERTKATDTALGGVGAAAAAVEETTTTTYGVTLSATFHRFENTNSIDRGYRMRAHPITASTAEKAEASCERLCLAARSAGGEPLLGRVAEDSETSGGSPDPSNFVCTHFTIKATAPPGKFLCTLHGGILNMVPAHGVSTFVPAWADALPAAPSSPASVPTQEATGAPPAPLSPSEAATATAWLRAAGVDPHTGDHLVAYGVLCGGPTLNIRHVSLLQSWVRDEPAVALFVERVSTFVRELTRFVSRPAPPMAAALIATAQRAPLQVYPHYRQLPHSRGEEGAAYATGPLAQRIDPRFAKSKAPHPVIPFKPPKNAFKPYTLSAAEEAQFALPFPNPYGGRGAAVYRFAAEPTDPTVRAFNGAWKNFRIARDLPQLFPRAHWYLMVDDDTYVVARAMRYTLALAAAAGIHVNNFVYAGSAAKGFDAEWVIHGGAGIIFSRALMVGDGTAAAMLYHPDGADDALDRDIAARGFFTPERLAQCVQDCTRPFGDAQLACCLGAVVPALHLDSMWVHYFPHLPLFTGRLLLATHWARDAAIFATLHARSGDLVEAKKIASIAANGTSDGSLPAARAAAVTVILAAALPTGGVMIGRVPAPPPPPPPPRR